jgi:hypothetical protein
MTTVSNGKTLDVTFGQTSSGILVDGGGILNVLQGGTIVNTVDEPGGVDNGFGTIAFPGKAIGTIVSFGARETIFCARYR